VDGSLKVIKDVRLTGEEIVGNTILKGLVMVMVAGGIQMATSVQT
jgi:hypothetical protein